MRHFMVAVISATMVVVSRSAAVDRAWIGSANGNWNVSGNWNPNGVPGTLDTVTIAVGTVPPPYNILFFTGAFQPINAVADRLRLDSAPINFTIPTSTLTLDSANTGETTRALLIGRLGSGTPNAQLDNLLAQLNTTYATLGSDAGSSGVLNVNGGTLNVTGSSATWDLIIGRFGSGTINVNNGSDVNVADDTVLGLMGNSTGTISVNGSGSTWTSTGDLRVGDAGDGIVNVSAGAALDSAAATLAFGASSVADASVTGAGSAWNTTGQWLVVGASGQATLDLTTGGDVICGSATLGLEAFSSGEVNISTVGGGNQSRFVMTGELQIGRDGTGLVNLADGGFLQHQNCVIGNSAPGDGSLVIADAATMWTSLGTVYVGLGGTGMIELRDGVVVSTPNVVVASGPDSMGTALLTGVETEWNVTNTITVGQQGEGSMEIADGALLHCIDLAVATQRGGIGAVFVDTNAEIAFESELTIGGAGDGSMQISNYGAVVGIYVQIDGDVTVTKGGALAAKGSPFPAFIWPTIRIGDGASSGSLTLDNGWVNANLYSNILSFYPAMLIVGTNGTLTCLNGGYGIAGETLFEGDCSFDGLFSSWSTDTFEGSVTLTNDSVMYADDAIVHDVIVDHSFWDSFGMGAFVEGTLTLRNGSRFRATQLTINSGGLLMSDDEVEADITNYGMIEGSFNIVGVLNNAGTLAPGASPGIISVEENFTQSTAGNLVIELASAAMFDQVQVTGTATLAGTLTVSLIDGFTPAPDSAFSILVADDVDGTFATANLPAGMELVYTATEVVLVTPPAPCLADFVHNATFQPPPDGFVTGADLAYLLGEWGPNPGSLADIVTSATFAPPPDGFVNGADLAFLLGAWGACP